MIASRSAIHRSCCRLFSRPALATNRQDRIVNANWPGKTDWPSVLKADKETATRRPLYRHPRTPQQIPHRLLEIIPPLMDRVQTTLLTRRSVSRQTPRLQHLLDAVNVIPIAHHDH